MANDAVRRPLGPPCLLLVALIAATPRAVVARELEGGEMDAAIVATEQKAAQAFEAYRAKRYGEAVALYIEAYDTSPNADILYNVARIYDTKLGDRPLAINFYRRYIADPGAVADRIQLANARLVALREAELAASQPVTAAPASGPLPAAGTPAREGAWNASEVTGAVLAASGVVAIGVGAGFGLAAMAEAHTSRQLCEGSLCREQRGIDATKKATDHALVSTIGFASGGALLALGAVCYFWLGKSAEQPDQAWLGSPALGARVAQSPGGWSLELAGSW